MDVIYLDQNWKPVPQDQAVLAKIRYDDGRIVFARPVAKDYSFPGHHGRPGERGGSLPRGESDEEVDRLSGKAIRSGGFTYNPVRFRKRVPPKTGFALSIGKASEKIIDVKSDRETLRKELKSYLHAHRDEIKKAGNFLGGWVDKNKLYLDVSTVVRDKDEALRLARARKQLAVYDLGKGETVKAA